MKILRYLWPIILISCVPQQDLDPSGAGGSLFDSPVNIYPGKEITPPPPKPPVTPPVTPPEGVEPEPEGATDFKVTSEEGVVTYLSSMAEAMTFAAQDENKSPVFSYKGKRLFARNSLLLLQNTNKPEDPVAETPLFKCDDLDNAYKMYFKKTGAGSYTALGPGGRGWHITYVFPLNIIKHQYSNMGDWWSITDWPLNGDGRPLVEQTFVRVAVQGNRNLCVHSDFVKEVIRLEEASDLDHVVLEKNEHTNKALVTQTYDEIAFVRLWGDDMPDGSETHPVGAQPAEFKKKPAPAVYNAHADAIGLAPSWMQENTKYYTFDFGYFYTDMKDMYKDIYNNSHNLAVNKTEKYISIYSYLNLFPPTIAGHPPAYTIDDFYEYVNDDIDNSQHYKKPTEQSILSNHGSGVLTDKNGDIMVNPYPNQIETFRATQSNTGINPGYMLAIAKAESGFGRSSESHADWDPFNFGGPYKSGNGYNCRFPCDPNQCAVNILPAYPSNPTICSDLCALCTEDEKNMAQVLKTPIVIKTFPLYWKDQFITGRKISIIGLKGGGVAQGYNPGMAWGTHVAGKYYQMDLWLGFKERDRINAMISAGRDPNNDGPDGMVNSGDDTLIYINPPTP